MMIDLTKPIEVEGFRWTRPPKARILFDIRISGLWSESIIGEFDNERYEAYRRLFEAAPKMLAMLKTFVEPEVARRIYGLTDVTQEDVLALLAEIEPHLAEPHE